MQIRSKSGVKRQGPSKEQIIAALAAVNAGQSQRKACKEFNVTRATLQRISKRDENEVNNYKPYKNCSVKTVFTTEEELSLVKYLLTSSKMHYGLHRNQLRSLAYSFALSNKKNMPQSWMTNEKAGKQWFRGFMSRHCELSLRKPEATSLARATSFNRHNVCVFFTNLKEVMSKYKFTAADIYNMDETGNCTVQNTTKIIAPKGQKQVGTATSGERGCNVTMIACINAVGNSVPPMFIFPRVNFKPFMLSGAPADSIGSAHISGWSNSEKFLLWLQHFIDKERPSPEHKKLLILDNHESHCSLEAVTLAKNNGIILVTLPPHTSHKLQPLDRSVFGPYKQYYNSACDEWLLNHPGQPITIYNVAELAGKAFPLAFTPKNILSGFRVSGIWPLDENIFGDEEYLCSSVTDREDPTSSTDDPMTSKHPIGPTDDSLPSTSKQSFLTSAEDNNSLSVKLNLKTPKFTTPEQIRPYPKAKNRSTKITNRKKTKSRILTDTPEKDEIERLFNERQRKENLKKSKLVARNNTAIKRKAKEVQSSEEEDTYSTD